MPQCFDAECNHQPESHSCSFFRWPKDKNKWKIVLNRRVDIHSVNLDKARLCSCHFVDGNKENGPTIFQSNAKKVFTFSDPEPQKKRKKKVIAETVENPRPQNNEEPLENESLARGSHDDLDPRDAQIEKLAQQIEQLEFERKMFRQGFSIHQITDDDNKIIMYTGLPSAAAFMVLNELIARFPINYYAGWNVTTILPENQLFMTPVKLRTNVPLLDLAHRFAVSRTTVSNVIHTYICVLHELLFRKLLIMPTRLKNQACLPSSFATFSSARITLDCTEIAIEVPANMFQQNVTYSHYKGRNTFKALVGVAPNGVLTFLSDLYPGSMSDKAIVIQSKVLDKMDPGDIVLADKGFLLHDIMPKGVGLNIPPFLNNGKFSREQVVMTRTIARARIHVERAICRIKAFQILNMIPAQLRPIASLIFQVCGALTNFQNPLIAEVSGQFS